MMRMAKYTAAALTLLSLGSMVYAFEEKSTGSVADFVAGAVECNTFQKDIAQKAAKSASNEDVKNFAERLAQHHASCEKDLLDLAKFKKVGVVANASKEAREKMADLIKLKDKDFDKRFLELVVEDHEKALKHMQLCASQSKDTECKAVAEKAIPTIKQHLEEARALQKKLN